MDVPKQLARAIQQSQDTMGRGKAGTPMVITTLNTVRKGQIAHGHETGQGTAWVPPSCILADPF